MGSGKRKIRRVIPAAPVTAGETTDAKHEQLFHMRSVRGTRGALVYDCLRTRDVPATDADYWTRGLEGFKHEHTGFSLRVPRVTPYRAADGNDNNPAYAFGRLRVHADIMKGRKPVGDLAFGLVKDGNGDVEMRIHAIDLRHYMHSGRNEERRYENTGNGFGTACVEEVKRLAREGGVKRISLHAVGGGAYFWARTGFDFDVREYKRADETSADETRRTRTFEAAGYMLEQMDELVAADPSLSQTQLDFAAALEEKKPKSLQELLALVGDRRVPHPRVGEPMPLAAALIEGLSWHGVCFLQ